MYRLFRSSKLLVAIMFYIIAIPYSVAEQNKHSQLNPDDAVPFSLSISGGVSLGSYEAGINWALLYYMKTRRTDYLSGIYPLYPDIRSLSGASAGSINTLFSAISWCVDDRKLDIDKSAGMTADQNNPYRFTDTINNNLFRDIWVNVGIEDLLPNPLIKGNYKPDDGLFTRFAFDTAIKNVRSTLNQSIFREDCYVPFGITVTRVKPGVMSIAGVEVENQRYMIPFRIESAPQGQAKAIIRSQLVNINDPGIGNVIYLQGNKTELDSDHYTIDADALINSILTSSAFPIAFGRKKLNYCVRNAKITAQPSTHCPENYQARTDEFLDGGLFDNVPLGIAKALAEPKPTDKASYLHLKKPKRRFNYVYINPDNLRTRTQKKQPHTSKAKTTDKADVMTFGISNQLKFLLGAINTGRNYELYTILRGGEWSQQTYQFACQLYSMIYHNPEGSCSPVDNVETKQCKILYHKIDNKQLLSNNQQQQLAVCLLNSARILENAYNIKVPENIIREFNCKLIDSHSQSGQNLLNKRQCLLKRIGNIANQLHFSELFYAIKQAENDHLGDRRILLSTRFAPLTGTMLAAFGAFLDRPFREYDYYTGVYDAIYNIANYHCGHSQQLNCLSDRTKALYKLFQIQNSAAANTIFTLLAKQEHPHYLEKNQAWQWLKSIPLIKTKSQSEKILVNNIEIIFHSLMAIRKIQQAHDSTDKNLLASNTTNQAGETSLVKEFVFFINSIFQNNYNIEHSSPFMKQLYKVKDSDSLNWFYPVTSRIATRLMQLEDQEIEISQQENYAKNLLGLSSLAVHSYIKNDDYSFSRNSTTPVDSWYQYLPYEFGIDARNGGLLFAWEPGFNLSHSLSLDVNIAPVMFNRFSNNNILFSQASLYLSYQHSDLISSFGIGPTFSYNWDKWPNAKQSNIGGSFYIGLMRDKLRLTLGVRSGKENDFFGDTRFIYFSITDIPGFSYWLFN